MGLHRCTLRVGGCGCWSAKSSLGITGGSVCSSVVIKGRLIRGSVI